MAKRDFFFVYLLILFISEVTILQIKYNMASSDINLTLNVTGMVIFYNTSNQIDHIVIAGRHVSSVLDLSTFRGPNIDSDHYLVTSKFRLRISASRYARSSALRKLDAKKVRKQRTAEAFSAQLFDKLRRLRSNLNDIGGLWADIFHSLRITAETVLGFERPPQRN